ncbi:MAG: hypothetical protein E6Q67_04580 [Roseateles sp.]|nr:MAG: hypothetical protein E6Q67_04580 [Roseateles sp.]
MSALLQEDLELRGASTREQVRHTQGTRAKLRALASKPDGWKFGRGKRPSAWAVETAASLLYRMAMEGLWRSNVFALEDGGVMVTFSQDGYDLEARIEASGLSGIQLEQVASAEVLIDEMYENIDEFHGEMERSARIVCSSEQSTQTISMQIPMRLEASPSSRPVMAESRFLIRTVQSASPLRFALT